MKIHVDDHLAYGGGQITDLDLDDMSQLHSLHHRGWGPDGSINHTIHRNRCHHHLVQLMRWEYHHHLIQLSASSIIIVNSAAVDLYPVIISTAWSGSGPLGIPTRNHGVASIGDDNYSPIVAYSSLLIME